MYHWRGGPVSAVGISSLVVILGFLLSTVPHWPAYAAPLPLLSVQGNQLLRDGQVLQLHGVNRDSLEWGSQNWAGCGGDNHFGDGDFDKIKSWNATAVRVPLSQANWLGRRCNAVAYAAMVDRVIARINARGMYAILDLHWSDVEGRAPCDTDCGGTFSGQQPMPDGDSRIFWQQVATRYANNAGVLFDLYNEPHPNQDGVVNDSDWRCWRDGGCTVAASSKAGVQYTAVGMQELYDTVRAAAPTSVVLVAGPDWASDLAGVGRGYALRGTNIVYDVHVYTRWHATASDWHQHFGFLTATYPVIATEFGYVGDCATMLDRAAIDPVRQLLDYFDAPDGVAGNRMSWTIWSWNTPGDCTQPSVIANWNGTPLHEQGVLIHDRLAAYAAARPQITGSTGAPRQQFRISIPMVTS
ncbi:MAG: hypothetical protein NVS2B7_19850 [Herpetosiphon sp.]